MGKHTGRALILSSTSTMWMGKNPNRGRGGYRGYCPDKGERRISKQQLSVPSSTRIGKH
jgi:hypothetical protein